MICAGLHVHSLAPAVPAKPQLNNVRCLLNHVQAPVLVSHAMPLASVRLGPALATPPQASAAIPPLPPAPPAPGARATAPSTAWQVGQQGRWMQGPLQYA